MVSRWDRMMEWPGRVLLARMEASKGTEHPPELVTPKHIRHNSQRQIGKSPTNNGSLATEALLAQHNPPPAT
jgi:hypothetical protein